MFKDIRNFLWGTFNYRNKGMTIKQRIGTGYSFMKITNGTLDIEND